MAYSTADLQLLMPAKVHKRQREKQKVPEWDMNSSVKQICQIVQTWIGENKARCITQTEIWLSPVYCIPEHAAAVSSRWFSSRARRGVCSEVFCSCWMMACSTVGNIRHIVVTYQSLISFWNVPVARNLSTDKTWEIHRNGRGQLFVSWSSAGSEVLHSIKRRCRGKLTYL